MLVISHSISCLHSDLQQFSVLLSFSGCFSFSSSSFFRYFPFIFSFFFLRSSIYFSSLACSLVASMPTPPHFPPSVHLVGSSMSTKLHVLSPFHSNQIVRDIVYLFEGNLFPLLLLFLFFFLILVPPTTNKRVLAESLFVSTHCG